MRIVSLLPSGTDIVVALGLVDSLVGVTEGIELSGDAAVAARTAIDTSGPPAEVDRAVAEAAADGRSLYVLDEEVLAGLEPDLVLTQRLCEVCAVPTADVEGAVARSGCGAEVISLDPHRLDDVLDDIERVGRATGRARRAAQVVARLRDRVEAVRRRARSLDRVRIFACEWGEPPFTAGHWVPDLIRAAGGESLLAAPGERSRRTTWDAVRAAGPDVLVHMPCGYGLEEAAAEARGLPDVGCSRVYAVAADRHFSRPGPRLVEGLEGLAWALHPHAFTEPPAPVVQRVR